MKRIEFIVTWQCGGNCKHCQVGDDINKCGSHRHVLADYAVDAVRKLSTAYGITSVMTFGGEPLYYPEVTAAIHRAATACGIRTRQILTNGYFTNSAEKSGMVATALADAGVNDLLLSVDAFHQEHIPIAPVYQFACDIIEAKLPGSFLYPAWLVNEAHKNPYNSKTRELLEKFSDLDIEVKRGNVIFLGGNATKFLCEYYDKTELNLSEPCGATPYSEPLTDVTSITIVPNGDVMICGFVLGNIYEEDVLDVIARYNPYGNAGMLAIMRGGVSAFLAYAEIQGIVLDTTKYGNACDICRAVAKQLQTQTRTE